METNPEQIAIAVGGLLGGGLLAWFLSRRQTTDETIRESVRTSYLDADRALMRVVNAAANMREAELRAKTAALQAQTGEEVSNARQKLATTAKAAKEAVDGAKAVLAEGTGPGSRTLATKVEGLEEQLRQIQQSLVGLANTRRDERAAARAAKGGRKRKNEKKTKRAKKHHGV